MKNFLSCVILSALFLSFSCTIHAQNIYELRKLTEDDWLSMSTEERMGALGTGIKHAPNQTFLGDFGQYYDMYQKWGYDFYEMEDRYENYGFRGFENYNITNERRRRWSYNEFGDRITKMISSGEIFKEQHYGDGTFDAVYADYYFNRSRGMRGPATDGLLIARESTNDWAVSVVSAGSLRKQFTPLTFSIPNMTGVAIDFQSANTSISTISSIPVVETANRLRSVFMRGGNIRRKFGILTLGATYANTYSVDEKREKGSSWFGILNYTTPVPLYAAIRFLDDSPSDNEGGPVIYEVRLKVNGRYRDDIQPQIFWDDITLERTTACSSDKYKYYLNTPSNAFAKPPEIDLLEVGERIPKYGDYILYNQMVRGNNLKNIDKNFNPDLAESYYTITAPGNKPIHVNGTKMAVYLFDLGAIPEKVNSVEAVVTVANDYRIQTSMIYMELGKGHHSTTGDVVKEYQARYWRTIAQADGNIKDGSNVRTIKLNFGYQVASVVYGFNADFNYRGFTIRGEYVTNSNHYMWADGVPGAGRPTVAIKRLPERTGHKWTQRDNAYYITTQKKWDRFGFAGELFKMGKFYRPYLDYYSGYTYYHSGSLMNLYRNKTIRLALIEDNDDNDEFSDTDYLARESYFGQQSYDDPDGVFPGNDEDRDGIPDNNKNSNTIPDYHEPFLMFDSVPDEFVFGDDFNNNTIPDFREDDMKLDTPYDLNRQGYHYFFRFTPYRSVNFIAGSLRTNGIGGEYRTWEDYFKFQINYDVFSVGEINAEYRYEKIQDNIRDPFVKVSTIEKSEIAYEKGIFSHYTRDLYFDELEYRNSHVNRIYLDSRIRAVPSITLENLMKFETNKQVEGNTYDKVYQPGDEINTFAMVNKIVYTKSFGNFIFSPGINLRFYKKARSESVQPLDNYLLSIPLVMFKYIISPQSTIILGMQGIPGFELNYKDYVQTENDYKRKTYTLEFSNRSVYFGYNVWASLGVSFDQLMYDEEYRDFEDYKSSTTFIRILLGW